MCVHSGLLLMGEEADQLGFRALFTIAANCPLLEVCLRLCLRLCLRAALVCLQAACGLRMGCS